MSGEITLKHRKDSQQAAIYASADEQIRACLATCCHPEIGEKSQAVMLVTPKGRYLLHPAGEFQMQSGAYYFEGGIEANGHIYQAEIELFPGREMILSW